MDELIVRAITPVEYKDGDVIFQNDRLGEFLFYREMTETEFKRLFT